MFAEFHEWLSPVFALLIQGRSYFFVADRFGIGNEGTSRAFMKKQFIRSRPFERVLFRSPRRSEPTHISAGEYLFLAGSNCTTVT